MMVNKIGDMAVLLGISISFFVYYSVDFSILFTLIPYLVGDVCTLGNLECSSMTALALLLFIGAVGKSAQLGLHT